MRNASLLAAVLAISVAAPARDLDRGLVGHWTFDDGRGSIVRDRSGNAKHGILVNLSTESWTKGRVGGALRFDGQGYVQIPEGFADFSGGLTIAVWAFPLQTGSWARFMDFGNGSAKDNIYFASASRAGEIVLHTYNGRTNLPVKHEDVIELLAWNHYAATMTAGGAIKFYKNGREIHRYADGVVPGVIARRSNFIGRSNWGEQNNFKGSLDDLRIYSRALSAAEIALLASGGGGDAPGGEAVAVGGDAAGAGAGVGEGAGGENAWFGKGGGAESGNLSQGLVAHFPFDRNEAGMLADATGVLKAVPSATGLPTSYPSKRPGAARKGRCIYLRPGHKKDIKLPAELTAGLTRFSFSWWVRTREDGFGQRFHSNPTMLGNRTQGVGSGDFGVTSKQGRIAYWSGLGKIDAFHVSGMSVHDREWHHVALTCDGVLLLLYLDGKPVKPSGLSAGRPLNGRPVHLGSSGPYEPSYGQEFHSGMFDELRVYKRALTVAEVRTLAAGGSKAAPALTAAPAATRGPTARERLQQLSERPTIEQMLEVAELFLKQQADALVASNGTGTSRTAAPDPAFSRPGLGMRRTRPALPGAGGEVPRPDVQGKKFRMPQSGLMFMVSPAISPTKPLLDVGRAKLQTRIKEIRLVRKPVPAIVTSGSFLRYFIATRVRSVSESGSVFCWINGKSFRAPGTVFARGQDSSYSYYSYYNDFALTVGPNGYRAAFGYPYTRNLDATRTLPTDEWLLIGFTWNGLATKLYINGVLDATGRGGAAGKRGDFIQIGANVAGRKQYFDGLVGGVFLYGRVLTDKEVMALYGSTSRFFLKKKKKDKDKKNKLRN